MVHKIADSLVLLQVKKGFLSETERAIYLYAYQMMISRCISIILLFIISSYTGALVEMALFMGAFILLRQYAGGFHLKSQEVCILFSAILISVVSILVKSVQGMRMMWIVIEGISGIIIFKCSPVETEKKKLDAKGRHVYAFRSRVVLLVEFLIFIGILISKKESFLGVIPAAHFVIVCGMVMELFKKSAS